MGAAIGERLMDGGARLYVFDANAVATAPFVLNGAVDHDTRAQSQTRHRSSLPACPLRRPAMRSRQR